VNSPPSPGPRPVFTTARIPPPLGDAPTNLAAGRRRTFPSASYRPRRAPSVMQVCKECAGNGTARAAGGHFRPKRMIRTQLTDNCTVVKEFFGLIFRYPARRRDAQEAIGHPSPKMAGPVRPRMYATATNNRHSFLRSVPVRRTRCARCLMAAPHNRCHPSRPCSLPSPRDSPYNARRQWQPGRVETPSAGPCEAVESNGIMPLEKTRSYLTQSTSDIESLTLGAGKNRR